MSLISAKYLVIVQIGIFGLSIEAGTLFGDLVIAFIMYTDYVGFEG